jgi:hypothetical protein
MGGGGGGSRGSRLRLHVPMRDFLRATKSVTLISARA